MDDIDCTQKDWKKGTNFSEMKYECFEKIRLIRNYKVTAIKIYKDALTDQKKNHAFAHSSDFKKIGLIFRNELHCLSPFCAC